MELAAGAVSAVLPKLSSLLEEEFKLTRETRGQIRFLVAELESIQSYVLRQPKAEPDEADVMVLRDVRELSYDIEDSVDAFMLRLDRDAASKHQGFRRFFRRTIDLLSKFSIRHRFSSEIMDIKSRVKEMSSRRLRYEIDDAVRAPVDLRLRLQDADASILVGMDGPREELSKLLLMEEEEKDPESAARLRVVSIVGCGGLGKTTLAQEVYRTTEAYFDCTAWVAVSRSPDIKKILTEILRQVGDRNITVDDDERVLITKIRGHLHDKRYLLALDDIWDSFVWETIKCVLPSNSVGSRIITTTRNNSVAESCCLHWNDCIYNIKPLSEEDSWKLFQRRAFGSEDFCPPEELTDVSKNILRKCGGLPLALISVASLLASKPREVWLDACNSLGSLTESVEGIKNIALLSYNDLPHHLKTCFLYLSIFPEDYKIDRARIIRRWMAEGFILQKNGRTLEEVGESYFNELIHRSMIQPHYGSGDGIPEACRIHDLMLDLIRFKSTEENFVTLLGNDVPVPVLHRKVRRLSLVNMKEDHYILERTNTSHIRSLSIFGTVGPELSFDRFIFLRVLDLEGCQDLKNHNVWEIAGLIHLRYLSIRDTPISELPGAISQLQNLITLDIRGTEIQDLPMSVVQLQRLVHLLGDRMIFPKGIGKMAALSCLSQLDILQSDLSVIEDLGNLSELRELVLWWFPCVESDNTERDELLAISLYRLNKLQSLTIHGCDSPVDFFDHLHHPLRQLHRIQLNRTCYLSRIPEWFRSLAKLSYVFIHVQEVQNEHLQLLSELPSLLHLSLSSKAMPTEKLCIRSNGFPVLQDFQLHFARADLTFEPQAMPKVEKLLLSLHALPEETNAFSISIAELRCLKKIDIRIYGKGADATQLFEVADIAIRKAAAKHPNNPVVNVTPGNLIGYAAEGKEKEQKLELIEEK